MSSLLEIKLNNLIQSALQGKYCKGCPNRERVLKYSQNGIYPRWGAGNLNAPIILIFERPGDQTYLCETGRNLSELSQDIDNFRKNFTEIMYTVFEGGLRYLDGILEFLYGSKSRKLSFLARMNILKEITYISEVVKCPGREALERKLGKAALNTVNEKCSTSYFHLEWENIILKLPQLPVLVIIATDLTEHFPFSFPQEIRDNKSKNRHKKLFSPNYSIKDQSSGICYLKTWHPSYVARSVARLKKELKPTADKFNVSMETDLDTTILVPTIFMLHQLTNLPNTEKIKEKILERIFPQEKIFNGTP